jgi:hypothetical protein
MAHGPLTSKERGQIPTDKFAGPKRSFPVEDKKHARLALSGAARSENVGNISAAERAAIDAKAKAVLNKGKGIITLTKVLEKPKKGRQAGATTSLFDATPQMISAGVDVLYQLAGQASKEVQAEQLWAAMAQLSPFRKLKLPYKQAKDGC